MNRSITYILFAAALLLAMPQAEARKGSRGKARVTSKSKGKRVRVAAKRTTRPRTRYAKVRGTARRVKAPRKQVIKRSSTRKAKPAANWASRKASRAKSYTTKKRRTTKRYRSTSKRRVVRISLRKLNKRDRTQVMGLMMSKRVRGSSAARALIGEYVRLRGVKGAKLPLSIKDLKQMTSSSRWSSKRMGNLAKVLRLANYYAKKDKLSGKAAFVKALKAAGVYKMYTSGKCGV